ncbi:MAG: phosphoribosylglycinamide formyltransferase [Rhodospirillales bacterium 20-64-7]|nr:MAG: phosphoribosylglycinamide formyltransferase [Rhodospirillales bacterium 20-64-7]
MLRSLAPATLLCAAALLLSGCGLVAAPCRVASAGLKIVPVAGQVAAAPTDACANAIDPTPTRS